MITLEQLATELGEEQLLNACEALNIQTKDVYEDSDPDLAKLRSYQPQSPAESDPAPTPTEKNGKSKGKSTAIAQTERKQQQAQGEMVVAKTQAAQAIARTERKQADKDGELANRVYTQRLLKVRSEGYRQTAQSYMDSDDALTEISEAAFLQELEEDGERPLVSSGGGFKLT